MATTSTMQGTYCRKRLVNIESDAGDMNVSIDSSRRRPSSSISCIETSNRITEAGTWERLVISRGDWVLMQPNRRRKRKYSNIFLESWKGRVKAFRVAEGKKIIKEVLVQHVYMHRELVVEQYPPYLQKNRPNCKCSYS